jgi:hypothetical protein
MFLCQNALMSTEKTSWTTGFSVLGAALWESARRLVVSIWNLFSPPRMPQGTAADETWIGYLHRLKPGSAEFYKGAIARCIARHQYQENGPDFSSTVDHIMGNIVDGQLHGIDQKILVESLPQEFKESVQRAIDKREEGQSSHEKEPASHGLHGMNAKLSQPERAR